MTSYRLTPDTHAWYDRMIERGYAEKNESYFVVHLSLNHSDVFMQLLSSVATRHASALDIGCGTGKYTEIMASCYAHVVGLDRSAKSLAYALAYHRKPNVIYMEGDAQRLPFTNVCFDAVAARLAPHDLSEILRVLKPTGFAICMRVGEYDAFSLREIFGQWSLVNKMRQYIERKERHSLHIVEQWRRAGFEEVNSSEHEYDMHFKTIGDLSSYLSRVPIIPEFEASNMDHMRMLCRYAEQHTHSQMGTIILHRHRYIVRGFRP